MFKEERYCHQFSWHDLGDPDSGRPNLGISVPVPVYRLLQYTMRDVIATRFDVKTANEVFFEAGKLAGKEFCDNLLDSSLNFNEFIAQLQKTLKEQKIGILRIEKINLDQMEMVITIAEDLDCSGLPVSDETVCDYDEGFLSGVLKAYTGKHFSVNEIDCWASGDRLCRFSIKLVNGSFDGK